MKVVQMHIRRRRYLALGNTPNAALGQHDACCVPADKPNHLPLANSTTADQLDGKWKPWLKQPKSEEHWPTMTVKVQKTGGRPTRFYQVIRTEDKTERKKMSEEDLEKVNWKYARVAVIVEIRNIWQQPHQLGATVDATEVLVHTEDETCGFETSDSE